MKDEEQYIGEQVVKWLYLQEFNDNQNYEILWKIMKIAHEHSLFYLKNRYFLYWFSKYNKILSHQIMMILQGFRLKFNKWEKLLLIDHFFSINTSRIFFVIFLIKPEKSAASAVFFTFSTSSWNCASSVRHRGLVKSFLFENTLSIWMVNDVVNIRPFHKSLCF